jgi:hypothetical protein
MHGSNNHCTTTHLGGISWIEIDASIHEGSMHVRDHGTHVSGGVGSGGVELEAIHSSLHVAVPGGVITVVD